MTQTEAGRKLVDIVNDQGEPTGQQSPLDDAAMAGLPFRGVHVIITRHDGRLLVERRSTTIMTHPGRLDLGLGGVVDANEEPDTAIAREIKEEVGIALATGSLRRLGIRHQNHYWPSIQRHLNVYLHSYHLHLHDTPEHLTLQSQEVAEVRFITPRQAQWLVRYHRLAGFGHLAGSYKYYRWLLDQLESSGRTAS